MIAFYNRVTGWVDEWGAVDVAYLDLRKAFDAVSHNIPTEKLTKYRLEKHSVRWIKTA